MFFPFRRDLLVVFNCAGFNAVGVAHAISEHTSRANMGSRRHDSALPMSSGRAHWSNMPSVEHYCDDNRSNRANNSGSSTFLSVSTVPLKLSCIASVTTSAVPDDPGVVSHHKIVQQLGSFRFPLYATLSGVSRPDLIS
jgi:hypothetical protein